MDGEILGDSLGLTDGDSEGLTLPDGDMLGLIEEDGTYPST